MHLSPRPSLAARWALDTKVSGLYCSQLAWVIDYPFPALLDQLSQTPGWTKLGTFTTSAFTYFSLDETLACSLGWS